MSSGHEMVRKYFLDTVGAALNDAQKQQLLDIIDNKTSTKQQIRDSVKAFCDGLGGDVQAKFNEVHSKLEAKKAEIGAKIKENEGKLSAETKAILEKAKGIKNDTSLTPAQEHEQMKALFDGAPANVKDELKALGPPFDGNYSI